MTEVYDVGHRRFGVRWSRRGLDAELRNLASAARGEQDAPANVSVVIGESTGRVRSKHQLYVQGQLRSMISGDGGLIRAVIRALGALAADREPEHLALDAFLVIEGATAVVVDRRLSADVRTLGPQLRRGGRRVVHVPHLDVSPRRRVASLPDAAAALGVPVAELDARWPVEPGDDDLLAGELPLTSVVYAGRPEPESRADAVADMLSMLRDPAGRIRGANVARLAELTAALDLRGVATGDRERLAGVLGLR